MEYYTNAIERKAVTRSLSIEDQINLPGALSEGLSYYILILLKLLYDDSINSLLGEISLLSLYRGVEKREEVAEVRVFDRTERKVSANKLSYNPPLELGSVERAN